MIVYMLTGFIVFIVSSLMLMYYGYISKNEGFSQEETLNNSAIAPGGSDERSTISPGTAFDPSMELLVQSTKLPAMDNERAKLNIGKMTSELCYKSDKSEKLKDTRNYLQRTNNYPRSHPDDCSAPNHELIGTFYSPFDGVGFAPDDGLSLPPSATCLR